MGELKEQQEQFDSDPNVRLDRHVSKVLHARASNPKLKNCRILDLDRLEANGFVTIGQVEIVG